VKKYLDVNPEVLVYAVSSLYKLVDITRNNIEDLRRRKINNEKMEKSGEIR